MLTKPLFVAIADIYYLPYIDAISTVYVHTSIHVDQYMLFNGN